MLPRSIAVALLTVALLTAGMVGPAAGEPAIVVPETVSERLDGLPAAAGNPAYSARVTTPVPFSMVGFEVPDGAELEFRTSTDGTQWSDWTEAEGADPDEGPDPHTAEARRSTTDMTEPVWVGEATHLQTRVKGREVAPEQIGVELIDSAGLGRSWGRRALDRLKAAWHGTPPAAQAMPGQPPIVTRKQWGADERLRKGSPSYASKIVMGVVHHTAGSNKYSRSEAPAVIRGIYRYHTLSRGWSDVGYNFLIDKYGTIYEGRAGGIERAVIGAHAGGFNTYTFGASLVGTFDSVNPPAAMRAALQQLLAWKYDVHHVDVLGQNTYTSFGSSKYSSGRRVTLNNMSGHKDVSSTACPGTRLYAQLPTLRSTVAQLQGPVLLDPAASPSKVEVVNGSSISGPVTLSTRLRPAGPWALEIRDPAGTVVHTAAGSGTTASVQWSPTGADRGRYSYTFSSPDRRSAEGAIDLVAPAIRASASPSTVRVGSDRRFATPVEFRGSLYDGARWRLTVTDPGGAVAHTATGSGRRMSSTWAGPANAGAGTYRWTLAADDVPEVSGTVETFLDRVARTAKSTNTARAAARISRDTFRDLGATRVVLTRADLPKFALSAGPLAGSRGPVLYTDAATLPTPTLNEIQRVLVPGSTIYVLGNSKVISDAALSSLSSLYTVQRVGDASPVRTAARAADLVLAGSGKREALAVGISGAGAWRQGFAATAYGADQGVPVLLVRRKKVPPATRRALSRNGVTSVTLVGNTATVSEGVRSRLDASRIGGKAPAGTARGVAKRLFGRRSGAAGQAFVFANVARDDGWIRALASAPQSARADAPLLAVLKRKVPKASARYLERLRYSADRMGGGWVLGRGGHVREATRDALSRHLQ